MTNIYPQDIELIILNRLRDNTYGIQAQLDIINAARGQSTPSIADANISDERRDENPEVIVDYTNGIFDIFFDETSGLKSDAEVSITAFLTSADLTNIKKWVSNYIEAIIKSLHRYEYEDLAFFVSENIIDDLFIEETQTTKFGGVKFRISINGGI